MSTRFFPFLIFKNAKEALEYYQEEFGAKVLFRQPMTEEQLERLGIQVDNLENTTAHAEFSIAGQVIICADATMGEPQSSSQVALVLDFGDDMAAAEQLFDQLASSDLQRVTLPFGPHQLGDKMGYLVDHYGITWVICAGIVQSVGKTDDQNKK